jgi:hypothetical protein
MSVNEYHTIDNIFKKEAELYDKKIYYTACKEKGLVPNAMFLTVRNATCKAISAPFKTASGFEKDLDLMAHRHTTDICELLSDYWGIEHDKVKLELGSSVQELNAKLESQVQSSNPQTKELQRDISYLHKKTLTHKKELEKERNYKLSRNISKENAIRPATDVEHCMEINHTMLEPSTNGTTIRSNEDPQLITASAIIHDSTQTRSTEINKQTCVKTQNSVHKCPRLSLSLRKTQESRKVITAKATHTIYKQNANTSSVIDNSITRLPTHRSKDGLDNETHVLANKTRMGKHKISNPNHNDEKNAKTPKMVHTEDPSREPTSTSDLSENDESSSNMDDITLSYEHTEQTVQQRESNHTLEKNKTSVTDYGNISTQDYTNCLNDWKSQEVQIQHTMSPPSTSNTDDRVEISPNTKTCQDKGNTIPTKEQTEQKSSHPVTEISSRKRPFEVAFNLNLMGVTDDMINNAILKVKATKKS